MPKGYIIAHVTVTDPEAYKLYQQTGGPVFARHGAKFLVRGGAQTTVEGDMRPRSVILEFPSLQAATACYNSPEYQAAILLRSGASTADICLIEGYDG